MHSQTDREFRKKWRQDTEVIIAVAQTVLAFSVMALYLAAAKPADPQAAGGGFTQWAVCAYPVICLARLAFVKLCKARATFEWVSAFMDVALLTLIIHEFSREYGTPAASLKAPTFGFYFILVTLHGLRFNPALTLAAGAGAATGWALIVFAAYASGATVTHSYLAYIGGAELLFGAEIEKIVTLLAFSGALALATWRGYRLLLRAQEAANAKASFLANMSHEIRTPMNGLLGMADILASTNLDERQRECVRIMQTSGDSLLTIINDILDLSKLEAGRLKLQSKPFNIRELIEETGEAHAPHALAKGVEIIVSASPTEPCEVIGDRARLQQVISNIVNNAVKFTEDGHVIISLRTTETDKHTDIEIDVKDTGVGIAECDQARIFRAFEQADNSPTREHGGTGLGLALCKKMVSSMGGTIDVASAPGEGTTFSVRLNLPAAAAATPASGSKGVFAGRRALLVGPRPASVDALGKVLREWGMNCICAPSAGRAAALLAQPGAAVDLIVLDAPPRDARLIRAQQRGPNTPILLLTSINAETPTEALADSLIAASILKPIRSALLYEHIIALISEKSDDTTRSRAAHASEQIPKSRLLLAEDNEVNRLVLREMLGGLGHEASFVNDGAEALAHYRERGADVVFVDVMMPRMDGFAAARAIRQFECERGAPRVPIIALTAHCANQCRKAAEDAGMDDILCKPVNREDLLAMIDRWASIATHSARPAQLQIRCA